MERTRTRSRRAAAVAAACATGLLLLSGCASAHGGRAAQQRAAAFAAGHADTPRIKIAMITQAAPGDTFWDLVRKDAQTAAAKDNVDLVYASAPNSANQANLAQNAIDQKVDGIAVTLADPDAMRNVVAEAEKKGIPVVGLNSGETARRSEKLLEFFGQDEAIAGEAFGRKLNATGARHDLCVIHEQGNVSLQQRRDGIGKTFKGKTDILYVYVNGADMPSVNAAGGAADDRR